MYFLCINTLDYANFILPDVPPNEREKLQLKKKKSPSSFSQSYILLFPILSNFK